MSFDKKPYFGILVFPGTNCETDCFHVLKNILGARCKYVWHKESQVEDINAIVIPGGFSYGDYLRSGAVAKFSPIMSFVRKFASKGGLVIGICNGFQILLEESLLPGAMLRNNTLKFICRYSHLKVTDTDNPFTSGYKSGEIIRMPIRHNEGNYYIDDNGLLEIKENNQVILKYCDSSGKEDASSNPNGSIENIAGICNKKRNIFGLMPHPEACCEKILGSDDGKTIFESMVNNII
ncbi:MAG: phosphoribosylformylglycinamidine synthase subunit PurQ [Actinomycetota bacterium]|jgi:phosphoribosylformylglycinamidine synthase|nr:phosphoribosylformylglycinamidine synthase subunit PurQ [Actinomycetota bacterium]